MLGVRLREQRQAVGLTQAELAARAGVSRQLVGAVEKGRHLPRVDAAVALAGALGVSVESLLSQPPDEVRAVVGERPGPGSQVRVGRVGNRLVCAPDRAWSGDALAGVDGIVGTRGLELFDDARPGTVVVGCDPAMGLAARLAGTRGAEPVLAVEGSTVEAVDALAAGRAHACVVHGRPDDLLPPPVEVFRWHLSRWQVGLAAPGDTRGRWQEALAGGVEVIQRRPGAGSQVAFERAVTAAGGRRPEGPVVNGHLEAVWLSSHTGLPAVTNEPAALLSGSGFRALEDHVAHLWVDARWVDEPGVRRLVDVVGSPAFRHRLAAVGGYDLAECGTPVAT